MSRLPVKPYATQLREHLAKTRAGRAQSDPLFVSFEDAWRAAVRACVYVPDEKDSGSGFPMDFAKSVFRCGYLRTADGSKMGALAERENTRPSGQDPDTREYVLSCGTPGCDEPADPWLCAEHAAIIDAIQHTCRAPRCTADTTGHYCVRHAGMNESNQRGSDARSDRRAA